jgi:L-asparaginase / beta-aspartyl-peptidase
MHPVVRPSRRRRPATPLVFLVALLGSARCAPVEAPAVPAVQERPEFMFVIHGGAGAITRDAMTPELEAEYRAALTEALHAGQAVLAPGGSALDAVEAAIRLMEDSPLFNAGRGAVFTAEGTNELDASIMDGRTLNAGAVAGVKRVRNPITLARLVMERSRHVMFAREGAESFGDEQGVEMVPEDYFFTQRRWEALQRARAAEDGRSAAPVPDGLALGTVGAVALDRDGNLAAGTSTGGMTNKRWGRIGDSPVIGAGTFASNESCAVSATGHGEFFIRNVVAYDVCARVRYLGESVEAAARNVIMERLVAQGADGGVVAMDRFGNVAMPYNTAGMYRGRIGPDGGAEVKIWDE